MNIQPQFLNSPEFKRFKKRIGLGAMEYLVILGCRCQQTKSPKLAINDTEDLELILNVNEGGQEILDALVSSGLVDPEGGEYLCTFFVDQNNQLLSNWRNGELKSIQSKSKQSNTTQSKPTQFNSTQPNAKAMPKQCSSTASTSSSEAHTSNRTDDDDYVPF